MLRVCLCPRRACVSLNSWFSWYCLSKCKWVIVRPGIKITRLSHCSCAVRRHVSPKLCSVFWRLTFVLAIVHHIRNDIDYSPVIIFWCAILNECPVDNASAYLSRCQAETRSWGRHSLEIGRCRRLSGMTVAVVPENQKTKQSWDTVSALRRRLGNSKGEWTGNAKQQFLRSVFSLVPCAKIVTVCLALSSTPNIAKAVSKMTRRMHMSMLSPSRKDDTVCKWKAFLCNMCSIASASTNHLEKKRNSEMKNTLRSRILKVFQHEY